MKVGTIVKLLDTQGFTDHDGIHVGDYALVVERNEYTSGLALYFPKTEDIMSWFDEASVEVVSDSMEIYR